MKLNKVPLYGRGITKSLVNWNQISFNPTEDDRVNVMKKICTPIDILITNRVCFEIVGNLKGWPVIGPAI